MRISTLLVTTASCVQAFVLPQAFLEVFIEPQSLEPESLWPHKPYFLKHGVNPETFPDEIKLEELNATAWDLYHLAEASNRTFGHPTRVIGSPGHWKTLNYILDQFEEMRDYYDVSLQSFKALNGKVSHYDLNFTNGEAVPLSLIHI